MKPLPANQMNDTQPNKPGGMFLSSIWMSGYGIAADGSGNLYFVTGNSDSTAYDGVTDIQESVVKESPDLTKVLSVFTPSDQAVLDAGDTDYGSGGVLLVPKHPSDSVSMGAAAGKKGQMYLLDLGNLGGKSATGIGGTPGEHRRLLVRPVLLFRRDRAHRQQWRIERDPLEGANVALPFTGAASNLGLDWRRPGSGLLHECFIQRNGRLLRSDHLGRLAAHLGGDRRQPGAHWSLGL